MGFKIKTIKTLKEMDQIEGIWKALEGVDNGPSIFQSWTWNRIWCEQVLIKNNKAHLDVKLLEGSSGEILAILPFCVDRLAGSLVHLTQFLGHHMSYHNDILLADPGSRVLAEKAVFAMLKSLGSRTVLHLRHLDENSMFTKQLIAQGIAEPLCTRLYIKSDPMITDQSIRLKKNAHKQFRRRRNKLMREFGIEFRVRSGKEFLNAFDELIDLHYRRFDSMRRSTLLISSNLEFLREVTSELSRTGVFEIVQLLCNKKTIAAALRARDKKFCFAIQSSFDPEFAIYSPKRLLMAETIRHAFEDLGCEIYDFGPGYDEYKYEWSPIVGMNYFCCVGGPGPYARAMAALYRKAFLRLCHPTQHKRKQRNVKKK